MARWGLGVALLDKSSFPRDKCCGEGLTANALRELACLGVDLASLPSFAPIGGVLLRSPRGRVAWVEFGTDPLYAAVARRYELDAAVVEAARGAGASLLLGEEVLGLEEHGSLLRVITAKGGALEAPVVVAADGAWSRIAKLSGVEAQRRLVGTDWHGFRCYAEGASRLGGKMWVFFERFFLPGYAWAFPLGDGTVNVGFGALYRGRPIRLASALDVVGRHGGLNEVLGSARPLGAWRSWPIPSHLWLGPLTARGGRVLFVGDAAGAADPMSGEGIGRALMTGRFGAQAVAESLSGRSAPGGRYSQLVREAFRWDDWVNLRARRVLSSEGGVEVALRACAPNRRLGKAFGRWLVEDFPRARGLRPWRR
jgi:flavin-dependent dehydrogenase